MIKIEIIEKRPEEISFPCIFRAVDSGEIVLFVKKNNGTVIKKGNSNYELGHYSSQLISCDQTATWEVFHGSVTLTQE